MIKQLYGIILLPLVIAINCNLEAGAQSIAKKNAVCRIFFSEDCPICLSYLPTISNIVKTYSKDNIEFALIFPSKYADEKKIKTLLSRYLPTTIWRIDSSMAETEYCNAVVTPEIVISDSVGMLLYKGRIDNRYYALGKRRSSPSTHEARDILEAYSTGKALPIFTDTPAVGCLIERNTTQ